MIGVVGRGSGWQKVGIELGSFIFYPNSSQPGMFQTFASITFPQGFRISKNIGHPTLGSGGKKTFKQYLKSEQTHGWTDRHTHGHFDL